MTGNKLQFFYDWFFSRNVDDNKDERNINKSKVYVLTVQLLFGIVIGISFTDYVKVLVPFKFNFITGMILLSHATVLLSIVGYSFATKARYHKNFLRFPLDVLLLFLYYQLVYSPKQSFQYFLSIYPIIFGIYLIWQILEYLEWNRKNYGKKEFLIVFIGTILFTVAFVYILTSYHGPISLYGDYDKDHMINYWPVSDNEKHILYALGGLIVGFRIFYFAVERLKNFLND